MARKEYQRDLTLLKMLGRVSISPVKASEALISKRNREQYSTKPIEKDRHDMAEYCRDDVFPKLNRKLRQLPVISTEFVLVSSFTKSASKGKNLIEYREAPSATMSKGGKGPLGVWGNTVRPERTDMSEAGLDGLEVNKSGFVVQDKKPIVTRRKGLNIEGLFCDNEFHKSHNQGNDNSRLSGNTLHTKGSESHYTMAGHELFSILKGDSKLHRNMPNSSVNSKIHLPFHNISSKDEASDIDGSRDVFSKCLKKPLVGRQAQVSDPKSFRDQKITSLRKTSADKPNKSHIREEFHTCQPQAFSPSVNRTLLYQLISKGWSPCHHRRQKPLELRDRPLAPCTFSTLADEISEARSVISKRVAEVSASGSRNENQTEAISPWSKKPKLNRMMSANFNHPRSCKNNSGRTVKLETPNTSKHAKKLHHTFSVQLQEDAEDESMSGSFSPENNLKSTVSPERSGPFSLNVSPDNGPRDKSKKKFYLTKNFLVDEAESIEEETIGDKPAFTKSLTCMPEYQNMMDKEDQEENLVETHISSNLDSKLQPNSCPLDTYKTDLSG